jgi:predicted acyl esterase
MRRVSTYRQIYPTVGPYHSFLREDALPLVPGEIAELNFELNPLSIVLPAGYRLRIAIAGADADVFARIPTSGDPTLHVHRSPMVASRVTLPIIPRAQS